MQNLLLVDDEKHVLSALKRTLRHLPFNVFTAQSANQAYHVLENNAIQVMVTDFKMPQENGADLIKSVSAKYPDTVSLMLSGQADYERVVELFNQKVAHKFIKKPWDTQTFVKDISDAFSHYQMATHSSWQKRVNALSSGFEQHSFERAALRLPDGNRHAVVCLMQLANVVDFSEVAGQSECEALQSEMVSKAQLMVSHDCISHCYSPEFKAFGFTIDDTASMPELLHHVRRQIMALVQQKGFSVKPDIRMAYRVIDTEKMTFDLLLEELKQSMHTTDIRMPIVNFDMKLYQQFARERLIRSSMQSQMNDGRFSLLLQPKVTLPSNLIESAEVLLRWCHSTLGWISPGEFIRLAEIDGQITELGNWVLEQGVTLAARLCRANPDLKSVSVNVSSRQLYDAQFVSNLKSVISRHDIAPEKIELEITETFIAHDIHFVAPLLTQLSELGVQISIDDFGAGGTAFNYLTDLPVNTLKLDRCLISDLSHSHNKQILVRKLIECCHGLNISVVAEGAEDEETLKLLREFRCDKVQGFIFSRAISPIDFEKMLIRQNFCT